MHPSRKLSAPFYLRGRDQTALGQHGRTKPSLSRVQQETDMKRGDAILASHPLFAEAYFYTHCASTQKVPTFCAG
jgi:hypothetical protein